MSGGQPPVSYEEAQSSKLWRKVKEAPFVPLGIAGLIGAVTYGAVQFKNRGNMSPSVYIMHFRVFAQGMVVGAITLGIGANIVMKMWDHFKNGDGDKGKK